MLTHRQLIPFLYEAAPYLPPAIAVPLTKEGAIDLAHLYKELVSDSQPWHPWVALSFDAILSTADAILSQQDV